MPTRRDQTPTTPAPVTDPQYTREQQHNRFWLKAIVATIIVCTVVSLAYLYILVD